VRGFALSIYNTWWMPEQRGEGPQEFFMALRATGGNEYEISIVVFFRSDG
jgi:hypothetical protein